MFRNLDMFKVKKNNNNKNIIFYNPEAVGDSYTSYAMVQSSECALCLTALNVIIQ